MNSEKAVSVVGERIRERRIELGLSQEELAKSVGYQTRFSQRATAKREILAQEKKAG